MERNPQFDVLRDALSRFEDLRRKHVDSHKNDVPKTLFHYTDVRGLEGILRNRTFWATDYRYLNDKEEIAYGDSLICKHMKDFLVRADVETQNQLKPIFREVLGEDYGSPSILRSWATHIFTISFSEYGNDLHQWRAYGKNAHGYSIGIDTGQVIGKPQGEDRLEFLKLVYDPAKQAKVIDSAIVDAVDLINYGFRAYDDFLRRNIINRAISLGLSAMMFNMCLLFKHQAFAEEKEWRVIKLRTANTPLSSDEDFTSDIKFRTSHDTLIPYLEVDLSATNEPSLIPITSIFLGPNHRNTRSIASLNMFLQSLKYPNDISERLHLSDIPYQ